MAPKTTSADEPAAFNTQAEALGWYYRADPALAFARPELHALSALWHERAAAAACGLPARADFDMRSLKPFLRNIGLLESIGGRFRFRLFGSALVDLFGERTGQYLDEMASKALLANWTAAYMMVLRHGGPVRVFNHKLSPILNGEMLAAPLAPDAEGNPMMMVAAYVAFKEAP